MPQPDSLRWTNIPPNNGSGETPAHGFGAPIPDPVETRKATQAAPHTLMLTTAVLEILAVRQSDGCVGSAGPTGRGSTPGPQ